MQFSFASDLAIRVLLYLDAQDEDRFPSTNEVAAAVDASKSMVARFLRDLVASGLIESRTGRSGGVRRKKPLEEILVSEVIAVVEHGPNWKFAVCSRPEGCNCFMRGRCGMPGMYDYAAHQILKVFDGFKLSDLQRPASKLAAREFARSYLAEAPSEGE